MLQNNGGEGPSSPSASSYQASGRPLLPTKTTKKKRIINGSLLPNFVIPSPYSRKNKVLLSFSLIAGLIILATVASILSLLLLREAHFGGMKLYVYLFTIDGVLASYVILMFLVTGIMRVASKYSKRFRYFISPFAGPLYTCLWAALCFEFLPMIVPEYTHGSEPTRVLREIIRIAASCSIVSAAGTILLLFIERFVYGDLQERLWNVMWSERCVAAVALDNHSPMMDSITQSSTPENVLSLSGMIREGVAGLLKWLEIEEPDPKDENGISKCASAITTIIMDKRYGSTGGNLYLGDLINIPDLSSKDANSLYAIFDTNAQGWASADDVKGAIEVILLEKKYVIDNSVARSLIVEIAHQMIRASVTTLIIIIVLVTLLEVNVYTLLVGLGTAFIGVGFALSTTIQGLLSSLQMIFFVRPFEIGDLVRINDGQPLQVEKVGVISTFFYSLDGYGVFHPNSELAKSKIVNWKRSRDVTFDIPLFLSVDTRGDHLDILKRKVEEHIGNNAQYNPRLVVLVHETNKQNITVILKVTLKTIWQERHIWMRYSSDLRVFAMGVVVRLGIQYEKSEIMKNVPYEPRNVV